MKSILAILGEKKACNLAAEPNERITDVIYEGSAFADLNAVRSELNRRRISLCASETEFCAR